MTIQTGDFADAAAVSVYAVAGGFPAAAVPFVHPADAQGGEAHEAEAGGRILPEDAQLYLRHVQGRETIRALARETGCHASTILRRIRRFESRRDDPLIDRAVDRRTTSADPLSDHVQLRRVLRRLAEPGAVLAVSEAMDKAIVTRRDVRTAVLDRALAEQIALRGWVVMISPGRITRHRMTPAGRAVLKALVAGRTGGLPGAADFADAAPIMTGGFADAPADFGPPEAQRHRIYEDRMAESPGDDGIRPVRVNIAESPLQVLARRRDASGQPFLDSGMVSAGERLREDFELAQMGPQVTQNWDRFLTAGIDTSRHAGAFGGGSERARNRVAAALRELGPGMGDLVLRVCCFLEGIELTERRLGWSARSGKVVLRLALMRLERHYLELYGAGMPMLG